MKHLGIIATVALATCVTATAQSDDTAKELIAVEQGFNDALLRADWKIIEQLEADDLVFTNADGSVTHKSDEVGSIKLGDEKFESIHRRHHQVEQDEHRRMLLISKRVQRRAPILGDDHRQSFGANRPRKQLLSGRIIFDEQHGAVGFPFVAVRIQHMRQARVINRLGDVF